VYFIGLHPLLSTIDPSDPVTADQDLHRSSQTRVALTRRRAWQVAGPLVVHALAEIPALLSDRFAAVRGEGG
jgi:hypothetical protein